jgi:hypothetical protein
MLIHLTHDISHLIKLSFNTPKSTRGLDALSGVVFERCEDKGEKSAPKFVPTSDYHIEEETIKSTKTHYLSNPKSSFNPKKQVRKETPKHREEVFVCMFCGCASHLDEFCFHHKRIEKWRFDYA